MMRLKNRLIARLFSIFPSLVDRFIPESKVLTAQSGIPWAPFTKGLKNSTVAIITTAGVHLKTDKPFDMRNPMGDFSFRLLPADTPSSELVITHDYYDHRDADKDINIVFPVDRLKELADRGVIGAVAKMHYGFMGHIDGEKINILINETAPEVALMLLRDGVDCVILTPG